MAIDPESQCHPCKPMHAALQDTSLPMPMPSQLNSLTHSITAMQETALAKLLRSESLAAVLRWHEQGQKRPTVRGNDNETQSVDIEYVVMLSIGLELECFLPDLGALVPDCLVPLREPQELFRLVARVLSERVAELGAEKCRSGDPGLVSAETCDWGRLWTTTADGSIQPQGQNPFPVELVSKRMGFQEFDVTLFCDMAHALRRPPLCAATNESTGVHVHLGCYPSFFSVEEVAAIMKVYLRFEATINELLLPVTRQRNRFCRDLREVLGRAQGLGPGASDEVLFAKIDAAVAFVRTLSPEARAACLEGSRVRLKKDELLLALLEEGGLFRLKRPLQALQAQPQSEQGQSLMLPAGLALVELSLASGQLLWRPPTCQDLQALWGKEGDAPTPSNNGDGLAEPPTPWTALESLSDDTEVLACFRKPDDVPTESLEHWLFRDLLIMERHGTRYCKLNIMRISQPSERATIEFRQFPGGDFNQPLLIWGWVKFLGLLVTHACACAHSGTGAEVPTEGSEEELKRFLQLSTDSLLVAWFRDLRNRLPKPSVSLQSMKDEWTRLWVAWAHAAGQLPEDVSASAAAVLRSARAWRRLFQAATGMKAIFPSTDAVWKPLSQRLSECEVYMQHLYMALAQHLRCHVRLLRAAEEVSRFGSLSTVVYTVLSDGRLRRSSKEMRELQATVLESLGWSGCPSELAAEIADLGRQGAELTLDYAKNLLQQCETACGSSASMQLCEIEIQDDEPLQRSEAWTGIQAVKEGASRMPHLHVWRVYHELCSWLLLPRVEEVTHIWAGLARRGWDSARVDALWFRIQGHTHPAARERAMAWFKDVRGKKHSWVLIRHCIGHSSSEGVLQGPWGHRAIGHRHAIEKLRMCGS
ncbi:unnamed protein product [Symbiodinium sp. CCMP2592]|nr:unnamed protein product [Symbiodinium sp. CCMP2592]